jgi:hypothetical protein
MKTLLSFILFLFALTSSAQQIEIIKLDSCRQFAAPGQNVFEEMAVRVSEPAQWNNSKTSMNEFFDTFFKQYVQKRAGGRITLSLLISKEGKCCFYQAQPNSNVRPDFNELKRLLDQTIWTPAKLGNQAVTSARVLFVNFDGKNVKVTSLD